MTTKNFEGRLALHLSAQRENLVTLHLCGSKCRAAQTDMNWKRIVPIFIGLSLIAADVWVAPPMSASEPEPLEVPAKRRKKKKRSSRRKTSYRRNSKRRKTTLRKAQQPETPSNDSLTLLVNEALVRSIPQNLNPGGLRVNSVKTDSRWRAARVSLNENFTYIPVTRELIDAMTDTVAAILPDSIRGFRIELLSKNRPMTYYINKIDKLPAEHRQNPPFVRAAFPYADPVKGMKNDVVALWHSHGRYYRPSAGAWMWQRPLLFETVEDIYTMGYILPYVVPMLENAGAYVMLPRERDINKNEVIVDNDTNEGGELYSQPYYKERTGAQKWSTGEGDGFIYDLREFRDTENPFEVGTYRQTRTVKQGDKESVAAWYADIPEDGEYAVYVSYKSMPESTADARYAVNYSGGTREFIVNQQMGGGTWIYLGTFPLRKGYSASEPIVTLTNITDGEAGTIVTADAVKIGGGMGNIARSRSRSDIWYDPSTPETGVEQPQEEESETSDNSETSDEVDETIDDVTLDAEQAADTSVPAEPVKNGPAPTFRTSGMPRFLEGARYWLHWAGAPESVYSPYHGSDDYKDDYTSRGNWVNWLAGGSRVLPQRQGLNIPVDVTMALHSDAGKHNDDTFVGTLGIFFTNDGASYADGTARVNSRMLTDLLMRQITNDIRKTWEPGWVRRSMWDKSYVEARVPEVPTALIELMSHQNYADMQYGLDPNFRFTVGRAIYKALARFLSERKDRELVIQPLPVQNFYIADMGKNRYRLAWEPTPDPLEPSAMPTRYVVFERTGSDMGFHKIGETDKKYFDIKVNDGEIHSFRIVAANEGGLSFPGETLALRRDPKGRTPVLILNGFTRVSGPERYSSDTEAGFRSEDDFGVPYIRDISFSGHQTEFSRSAGESSGRSSSSYITTVIAGNTFDFPAIHGQGIADAGRGFVSASVGAVEQGAVKLGDYRTIDLILGKQKALTVGNGSSGVRFTAFPKTLRHELEGFLRRGGDLLVSGQYVASDLYGSLSDDEGRQFASEVLGLGQPTGERVRSGRISAGAYADGLANGQYDYSATLNPECYIVELPDVLVASGEVNAEPVLLFPGYEGAAALAMKEGKSRRFVMSVPLESISDEARRRDLMRRIVTWLED